MKVTIKDGNLNIDVQELIQNLSDDDRKVFAQYAVFREQLFSGVVDTLVNGECFEDDDGLGGWWISGMTQTLRLKLLPLMPAIVVGLVEKLLEENSRRTSEVSKHKNILRVLLDAWPKNVERPVEWCYVRGDTRWMNATEAEEYIARQLGAEWEAIKARAAVEEASVS